MLEDRHEEGFYWVRLKDGLWTIGQWINEDFADGLGRWLTIGDEIYSRDNEFSEIGSKIERI